jgi:excinuclease ABC subunit A
MLEINKPRSQKVAGADLPGFVRVRGAREHNLKSIDLAIPRDALVVFTGVSGSGKSSLAFGTLYAEAQRRYLESVSPYARRLFHQMAVPEVDEIDGLPPAVALQQQRGSPTTRSSVGSVTTLSNLLRMLYSRAGDYPRQQAHLDAEAFSTNTPAGACPRCHGLGRVYEVTERSMVPDDSKSIRERAIAAWPPAWHGGNLRDMLISLGYDVDRPWRELPKKARDWILYTDEQPVVPVYIGYDAKEVQRAIRRKEEPSYRGNFSSARRYVLNTFATTESASIKKRVSRYMVSTECPLCHGKRLRRESLSVKFAGFDIADISRLPLAKLAELLRPYAEATAPQLANLNAQHPEKALVVQRIAEDFGSRLTVLLDLGLGYLSLERSTPTLSPGELQRLRLATQVRSNLFGVVYVLDEPFSRTSSRGYRGAFDRTRPIESLRQFAVRSRTRDRCNPACGLGCRRRPWRRRTRWPGALQWSATRVQAGRRIANPPLLVRRRHRVKPNAALAQGLVAIARRQSQQPP